VCVCGTNSPPTRTALALALEPHLHLSSFTCQGGALHLARAWICASITQPTQPRWLPPAYHSGTARRALPLSALLPRSLLLPQPRHLPGQLMGSARDAAGRMWTAPTCALCIMRPRKAWSIAIQPAAAAVRCCKATYHMPCSSPVGHAMDSPITGTAWHDWTGGARWLTWRCLQPLHRSSLFLTARPVGLLFRRQFGLPFSSCFSVTARQIVQTLPTTVVGGRSISMASTAFWGPRGLGLHARTARRSCHAPTLPSHRSLRTTARAATGKCFLRRRHRRRCSIGTLNSCIAINYPLPSSARHITLLAACVPTLGACRWQAAAQGPRLLRRRWRGGRWR
jgi:hypothetical protein